MGGVLSTWPVTGAFSFPGDAGAGAGLMIPCGIWIWIDDTGHKWASAETGEMCGIGIGNAEMGADSGE
ncbi:hypothetical protein CTA1_1588 [Colletotrichum tanaceti]|uniref:Uncharacterized protein n=1 Tax=Colletotrichum tanaceti TaxID=1306861 RepID=A0A4U6X1E3_9PEZI|nr:hypothetical protein CTA1_1588 [Colletotrichum tanaceti]